MIFADDASGFEFEDRPQLTLLRNEIKSKQSRRADVVIIEHLDRLSRNAEWHQGYLRHELETKHGIELIYWKDPGPLTQRAVMGAVAQEGMERAKQVMIEGKILKAKSGRVTATSAAYGYKLVDDSGKEGERAKRFTYYAINDEEAEIVRQIFQRYLLGDSMRQIAFDLEQTGIKPPKKYKHWEAAQIRVTLINEVYKGNFYSHRWEHKTIEKLSRDGISTRKVKCKVERPREEWIHVPVPAIVSPEDWDAANRMLAQNKKTARRNAKVPYLLTGLVKCAYCGWSFTGSTHRKKNGKDRHYPYRGYRCPFYSTRPKYLRKSEECQNSQIRCDILDDAVWHIVCEALLNPQVLIDALESDATSERNKGLQAQIAYLQKELDKFPERDRKLARAYEADAFDAQEYAAERKKLKEEMANLNFQIAKLRAQVQSPEQVEERKRSILNMSSALQQANIKLDPPFELKQRILRLVIDKIVLDVKNGRLELDGAINGVFTIVNTHMGRGCARRPARNSRGTSGCLWRG
ncbi:MAG: recombinase family protein [Chloroflexi bacterium]|nr:recombinase family protein [Chloroflexota bacterium]